MLRKLILAVLVLSLTLAFVGTAFSTNTSPTETFRSRPAIQEKTDQNQVQMYSVPLGFAKAKDFKSAIMLPSLPSAYAPAHQCELLDLDDPDGANYSADWYGDDSDELANRFEVQSLHEADVYGATAWIYEVSDSAGGCDLIIKVYEDDLGVPGTLLHTETVPAATMIANGQGIWLYNFSSPVHITGNAYFISISTGGTAAANDFITFGLTQNADGTAHNGSFAFWSGGPMWMSMTDYFGAPVNVRIAADVCYTDYSQCFYSQPDGGYVVPLPLPVFTDGTWNGYGNRYEAMNDTLKTVHVFFYIDSDTLFQAYKGTNETNGVEINVWPDDGAGNIDISGGPIATRSIAGGLANMFPTSMEDRSIGGSWVEEHVIDFSADNLVMRGFYHVTVNMTSDDPADGQVVVVIEDFGAGGSLNYDATPWEMSATNLSWNTEIWGNEAAFMLGVTACMDEFQACQHQTLSAGGFANGFTGGGNMWKVAQKVKGSAAGNRPEVIRFQIADEQPWGGAPGDNGDPDVAVNVYTQTTDGDGVYVPGTVVYSDTIDPTYFPGWNEVVIPEDVLLFGDFWVGYEMISADENTDWFNFCMDLGPYDVNGGAYTYYEAASVWIHTNNFGGIDFNNWIMNVDFCSVPVPERVCTPGDWSTLQGDFARTGASGVAIGDAACNLIANFEYAHTGGFGDFVGPIIYDGKVITTFRSGTGSDYVAIDLASQTPLWTISVGGNAVCIPTAAYSANLDMDLLFVTGGDDVVAAAYNLETGALVWEILAGGLPGMATTETNQYGNFIVNEDTGVLYFTTNVGKVFAVWMDDGTQTPEIWPVDYYQIGSPGPTCNRTGCTDGENLYYAYSTIMGGDVVSISAATGAENWTLTSADGLKGTDTWGPGITVEQFAGGISYSDGYIYCISTCATNTAPIAGVFYKINASSGIAEAFSQCNGTNTYCTPVIDQDLVYAQFAPGGGFWTAQVNNGVVQAFSKADGTYQWGVMWGEDHGEDYARTEMVLTCEPDGAADLLFVFTTAGYLHCIDVTAHTELFTRRITDDQFGGGAGAIGLDTLGNPHLVFNTAGNLLIDLVPGGVDRPRLEFTDDIFRMPVPFGDDNPYVVAFDEVFTNTGCADLDVTIDLSDVSNGTPAPIRVVRDDFADGAAALADRMTMKTGHLTDLMSPVNSVEQTMHVPEKTSINRSAMALYDWVLNPTINLTAAPGDLLGVDVEVNQGLVGRGVFNVYAQFTSNDPDYWLDQAAFSPAPPEVMLVFMGGCLTEKTEFLFGAGLVNNCDVYNTGRLAESGTDGPTFAGNNGGLYQGMYSMAVSERRLSWNAHSWIENSTDSWRSWLPDQYNGECVPELEADVQFGSSTEDGVVYTPVMGNGASYNSIDSVQNFDDGTGTYDWTNFEAPYDNDSTMGLYIHNRHIGAYQFDNSVDLLGNATVEIFQITERNDRALPGWRMGNYLDYDVGDTDTSFMDASISASMVFGGAEAGARDVMGMIKIPFGCGYDPMINAWAVDQDTGFFGDGADGYPDRAYAMMTEAPGSYSIGNMSQVPNDQAASATIIAHDFAPGETIEFAVANYWVHDNPNSHVEVARLAHQLNKWMGFGRGDVNNDDAVNLADIIYIANRAGYGGPGAIPFAHLADVNIDGDVNMADAMYLVEYYFNAGPCPLGEMLNN